MKKKKLLTLDQLAVFCETQKLYNFNSQETGHRIYVQVLDNIEFIKDDEEDDFMKEGLMFCPVRVCHTLNNRNKSYISESDMKKALPSLAYRPLLGMIHQLDDGSYDFHAHDMELVENEDGDYEYDYLESQIGTFTADKPKLVYDEKKDKTYVEAMVAIPEEYSRAADIIKAKGGTKVSCELAIDKLSYDADNKWLVIEDFIFSGVTCLGSEKDGTEIKEGMEGSRLAIDDFSQQNNSLFIEYDKNNKLIETLERLNNILSNFNIDEKIQKGGLKMTKFEELLQEYDKSLDDIDFEYDGLSDDELEAKFKEVFGDDEEAEIKKDDDTQEDEDINEVFGDDDPVDGDDDKGDDESADDEVEAIDDDETPESKKIAQNSVVPESYSITMSDGTVKTFALSLQDKISALTVLVNETYGETDGCWYDVIVYDKNIVMSDWWTGKAYRQDYKVRSEVYSLVGDRVPVHSIYVTDDEEKALEELKASFISTSEELEKYHKAEEDAKKKEVLKSEEYELISDKDEYKEVVIDNYSLDELKHHLDDILLKYVKEGNLNFAAKSVENKVSTKKTFGIPSQKKKGRYGSIFKYDK